MLTQFDPVLHPIGVSTPIQADYLAKRQRKGYLLKFGGFLLTLFLALCVSPSMVSAQSSDAVIEDAIRATVRIRACYEGDCDHSFGSGAIIHPSGTILTAFHLAVDVDEETEDISVADGFVVEMTDNARLAPQPKYRAGLVAFSTESDLAILQIYADEATGEDIEMGALNLPYLKLTDPRAMQIGEPIHVLGYPAAGGLAVNYTQHPLGGFGDDGAAFKIQATISKGNSGGPALVIRNGHYEVAGITSFRIGDFGEVTWFVGISRLKDLFWDPDFPRVWAEDVEIIATSQGGNTTLQVRMQLNMIDFVGGRGEAYLLLYERGTEELWTPSASASPLERLDDGEAVIRGAFSAESTIVVDQPLILDHPGANLGIAPESLIYGLILIDPESEDILWGDYDIPLSYGSAPDSPRVAPEPYAVLNGPLDPVVSGVHTFDWSVYNHQLQDNQAYSIVFWDPRKGETPLEDGVAPTGFTRSTSIQVDLNQVIEKVPEIVENEYYRWGIILLETSPSFKRVAYLGGDHKFWLTKGPAQAQAEPTAAPQEAMPAPQAEPESPPPSNPSAAPAQSIVTPQGTFASIQSAIDAAPAGSTLTIPAGTYYENLIINKEIHLVGSGSRSDVTIISQDNHTIYFNAVAGTLRNLTVILESSADEDISDVDDIFALRILSGQLLVENCDISGAAGAGVSSGANPTFRNNYIYDSLIAILVFEGGQGLFEGNEIYDNLLGMGVETDGNPTVRGNQIYSNEISGISVSDGGRGTFEENHIYDQSLVGVSVDNGGNPIFRNNQFYNNTISGIMVSTDGLGLFEGNTVYENPLSGIAVQKQGNPTMRFNQVYDNGVGILVIDEGQGTYEYNDIYGNASVGIGVSEGGAPVARDNRVSHNKAYGIAIKDGGSGTYTGNDLSNNKLGAWDIENAGSYEASGNIE